MVGVIFRLPDPQAVRLSPVEVGGQPWALIVSDVCPEAQFPLRAAVQLQTRMTFAALVVKKQTWLLRHSVPLSLTFPDLERNLRLVGLEAARLRALLAKKTQDPKMFSTYED
jgi:hypothetical protein